MHTYVSKTGKKGNFLLFGIAIVFQIADFYVWLTCMSVQMYPPDMFGLGGYV